MFKSELCFFYIVRAYRDATQHSKDYTICIHPAKDSKILIKFESKSIKRKTLNNVIPFNDENNPQ